MSLRLAIWKSSRAILLLFLPLQFLQAEEVDSYAQTLGLSGSARLSYWEKDKRFSDERDFGIGSVWLQSRPPEFLGFKALLDARLQAEDLTRSSRSVGDLREGFVESSVGDFDIRVGRQITVWGRADKINPTDVWSVKDQTLIVTDDEDQRTGIGAAQLVYNMGNFRWIGLWQPEFRLPIFPTGNLPSAIQLQTSEPKYKSDQWGIKLDHSGGAVDWSFSFAHSIDRTPDLSYFSVGSEGVVVETDYAFIDTTGVDFATTWGSYGLRGELAYTRTSDTEGDDPFVKNPFYFGVLGVERSFGGDFNVNVQYVQRHVEGWRDAGSISDPNARFLAGQLQLLSFQSAREFRAASLRLSYKMLNDALEIETAFFGVKDNSILRPKITYAFSDSLRGLLGAEIYSGSGNTFFGRLKDLSSGFAEVRYFF